MAVIIIGGEKGGTGKSTVSSNLAIMACLMGKDVALIDCDKQQSATKYIEHRNELQIKPSPACMQLSGKHVYSEIEDLTPRFEHLIIDTGGRDSIELRSAMMAKTLRGLYSPFQPSAFDLETLETIDKIIEHAMIYNPALKAFSFINRASTNTKVTTTNDAIELLESAVNIKYCGKRLSERVPFQHARTCGLSVVEYERQKIMEMPQYRNNYSPKASIEICDLFQTIFGFQFDYEGVFKTPLIKQDNQNTTVIV